MGKLTCFSLDVSERPILQSGYSRNLHALNRVWDVPTLGYRVLEGIIILQSSKYMEVYRLLLYGSTIEIEK